MYLKTENRCLHLLLITGNPIWHSIISIVNTQKAKWPLSWEAALLHMCLGLGIVATHVAFGDRICQLGGYNPPKLVQRAPLILATRPDVQRKTHHITQLRLDSIEWTLAKRKWWRRPRALKMWLQNVSSNIGTWESSSCIYIRLELLCVGGCMSEYWIFDCVGCACHVSKFVSMGLGCSSRLFFKLPGDRGSSKSACFCKHFSKQVCHHIDFVRTARYSRVECVQRAIRRWQFACLYSNVCSQLRKHQNRISEDVPSLWTSLISEPTVRYNNVW